MTAEKKKKPLALRNKTSHLFITTRCSSNTGARGYMASYRCCCLFICRNYGEMVQRYEEKFKVPSLKFKIFMKAVEMLRIGRELLKVMSENDIARDDWQYVSMYEEFVHRRMMRQGVKRIVRDLAEQYGVSIRTVERVRKRLGKDVKW